jgi:hypothetical protein
VYCSVEKRVGRLERTASWLAVALGACTDRGFGEDVRIAMVVRVVDDRSEMQVLSCNMTAEQTSRVGQQACAPGS